MGFGDGGAGEIAGHGVDAAEQFLAELAGFGEAAVGDEQGPRWVTLLRAWVAVRV